MAISNVGTQDGTSTPITDDVNPGGTNPPQDNQDNTTEEVVEENQDIDLNLDLSDVVKEENTEIKPEDDDVKTEEISLDLEDSSVAETSDQQINFQDVTPPIVEETEETVEEVVEDKTIEDTKNKLEDIIEDVKTEDIIGDEIINEDIKEENTEDLKTDDLSMDLPEVPSKDKDEEWLKEEDEETSSPEKSAGEATIEKKREEDLDEKIIAKRDASGLDLSAISQEKIQESEGGINLNEGLNLNKDKIEDKINLESIVKETTPAIEAPVMQSGGMLNLDDLGAMANSPVQAAPEINEVAANPVVVVDTPAVTAPAVITPTIETPVVETAVIEQAVPPVVPVAAAVIPNTLPVMNPEPLMNPELNAAYAATAPNTGNKEMHKNTSSSRKIVSIVVLVALMLGGGFYIFKTMFPDKVQNIMATDTSAEIIEVIDITGATDIPETPTIKEDILAVNTGDVNTIPDAATTVDTVIQNTGALVLTDTPNNAISISGLDHSAADDGFDPFAEIEDILDKTNPNQDKIDILEDLLKIGEDYFALGDMAQDATILKYARVLTQKIPEDIIILETGTGLDLDKIDQHISLFETYIKKLEDLASIE